MSTLNCPSCGVYVMVVSFTDPKSKDAAAEIAKKKAELERCLQDVSGKLGSKPKKGKGKLITR